MHLALLAQELVTRERTRRRGGVIFIHVRGHSDDVSNDQADELVQWEEMAGPYCRLPLDKEGEQYKLESWTRLQSRLTEEENKKIKPKKNNKNNTVAAAEDITVSLGDTGITVTNTNTRSANGASTIYLPSTTLRQHLYE